MLENESQGIACDFDASQGFRTSHRGCAASQRVAGPIHAGAGPGGVLGFSDPGTL